MKLKVKFMSSETIELEIDSLDKTVLNLKEKIAELKESSTDLIRLIFSGKILEDSKSLESYKIEEGLTVICLITKKKIKEQVSNQDQTNNNSTNNLNQETSSESTSFDQMSGAMPSAMPFAMPGGIPGAMPGAMPSAMPFAMPGGIPGAMPQMDSPEGIQMLRTMLENPQMNQMMQTLMQNPQMKDYLINSTLQNMNIPQDSPMRPYYENMLGSLFSNPQQYFGMLESLVQMQQTSHISNSNDANLNNMMDSLNITPNENITEENNVQNNDEVINENLTESNIEVDNNELREKYAEQIQQIKNMGFEDEDKIIEVLAQSSGSVSIAINKLFT